MRLPIKVKEALAYPVRGKMEDRALRIPYKPEIRADLRAVTKRNNSGRQHSFHRRTQREWPRRPLLGPWPWRCMRQVAAPPNTPTIRCGRKGKDRDERPIRVNAGLGQGSGLW